MIHRWTEDTPTSRRQARTRHEAEKAEADARRVKQIQERHHATVNRPLTKREQQKIQELSRQGLIRSAEAQEHYKTTMRKLAGFRPEKAEAIAERWQEKGPGRHRVHR
jgi:hypothetical protein